MLRQLFCFCSALGIVIPAIFLVGCTQFPGEADLASLVATQSNRSRRPYQRHLARGSSIPQTSPFRAQPRTTGHPAQRRSAWTGNQHGSTRQRVQPVSHHQTIDANKLDNELSELNPSFEIARQHERQGRNQQAVDAYKQLIKRFPNDPRPFHRLAVLYDKAGRGDLARRPYQIAIRLAPSNAELLTDFGYSLYLQGDLSAAAQYLRRAIRINNRSPRAHTNLALVLVQMGQHQNAIQALQQAGLNLEQARSTVETVQADGTLPSH